MPYILKADRRLLTTHARNPKTVGELNFMFTWTAIMRYRGCDSLPVEQAKRLPHSIASRCLDIARQYIRQEGLSYTKCNDILGALDGADREFRRRRPGFLPDYSPFKIAADIFYSMTVTPYENEKRKENGDIDYDTD